MLLTTRFFDGNWLTLPRNIVGGKGLAAMTDCTEIT